MGELEELWNNKQEFKNKHISQVLSWVSNLGKEEKTKELRKLFSIIPISQIEKYANECREEKFEENGFIFQDLVNELGKRIGYQVEFGVYRGKKGKNGFDGLWKNENGYAFIVESKVTDNFPPDLDRINAYKKDLIVKGKIVEDKSSMIIVVGREKSKTMENMINGSDYKSNTIKIGIDKLIQLAKVKQQNIGNTVFDRQVVGMFRSKDNISVDNMVELFFSEKINKI